jgi:hypothetical protein
VLAAVKVVFLHMRNISQELSKGYLKKMAPPLGKYSCNQLAACNTDTIQ